jgi:uracil-DNA glycosylase
MPCHKCTNHGFQFVRNYEPDQYIEGNRQARVWIVGLNPKQPVGWQDQRLVNQLETCFDGDVHSYFDDFSIVSTRLYMSLGEPQGTAHTDLVKCSSLKWPPQGANFAVRGQIIANCSNYLQAQLQQHMPEMIICNGSDVSSKIQNLYPRPAGTRPEATAYVNADHGQPITIVLSGFIGRLDNFAKRRLGAEIEARLPQPWPWGDA